MNTVTPLKKVQDSATSSTKTQIRFIRKKEVMSRTGLSSTGIYDLMARNLFPKSIKLAGGKAVAWLESDVVQWQQQCLANQVQGAK